MKKLLALGLSLAMMASLTAVAFAAEPQTITNNDPEPREKEVLVQTTLENAADYEAWTVTVPATPQILEWGQPATVTMDAVVEAGSRLVDGATLTISATPINALLLDGTDDTHTIDCTFPGISATVVNDEEALAGRTIEADLVVDAAAFTKAGLVVGTYSNTTTYTVEYNPAAEAGA